jgi:hypothetical protein
MSRHGFRQVRVTAHRRTCGVIRLRFTQKRKRDVSVFGGMDDLEFRNARLLSERLRMRVMERHIWAWFRSGKGERTSRGCTCR